MDDAIFDFDAAQVVTGALGRTADNGVEQGDQHVSPVVGVTSAAAPPIDFGRESRFRCEPYEEIAPQHETWLVKTLLPSQGVGFIAGPSGAGKSFLTLDWALQIASGGAVLGHRTKRGAVVYIAAEGANGVRKRVEAWRRRNKQPAADFYLIGQAPHLGDEDDFGDLAQTLRELAAKRASMARPLRLAVVDTLAASMPGMTENESRDMSAMLHRLQTLAAELDLLILIVTHTGKDEGRGIRGWSGQHAAADVVILLERENGDPMRYARVAKMKDGEDGATFGFQLETVELGVDADGDPITSAIAVFDLGASRDGKAKRKPRKLPATAQIVLDALKYLFDHEQTVEGPTAPGRERGGAAVTRDALRERAQQMGLYEGATKEAGRQRFHSGLERLKAEHLIRIDGEHVWLVLDPAADRE